MADSTKNVFVNFNDVLQYFGSHGRFQTLLIAAVSMTIIPMAFPVLLMYFVALDPPWKCVVNSSVCILNGTMPSDNNDRCSMPRTEWEYTESRDYSIITHFDIYCERQWIIHLTTSVYFIGWCLGGLIVGWISDNYGRKVSIIPSVLIILTIGVLLPFSPNIAVFILGRFIIGLFTHAATYLPLICVSEFVTSRYRPIAISIGKCCFPIGYCILAMKAYLIREWKTQMIICSAPYFVVLAFVFFIPESIRWLYLKNRKNDAMKIIRRIAYWNKKEVPANILLLFPTTALSETKSYIVDIFSPVSMAIKSFIIGFAWFADGIVVYGLALAANDLGGSLYLNFILITLIEIPASMFSAFLCGFIGRKKTVSFSSVVASLFCIAIAFIPTAGNIDKLRIIFGVIGKFCIVISYHGLLTWSLEMYPTKTRAQAIGFFQLTGKAGAASAPWVAKGLKSVHHLAPFLVMGGSIFIAGCLLIRLPETKDMVTEEGDSDEVSHSLAIESNPSESLAAYSKEEKVCLQQIDDNL